MRNTFYNMGNLIILSIISRSKSTWQGFLTSTYMTTKKKVLIIDDEEDACLLLKHHLSKSNFEVHCSYTLKDGLQQVVDLQPDIIFLDNNLPDGFGWEASATLLKQFPNIEIHLISAYNNSRFDYRLSNAVKIWQKPISFKKLDEQLSREQAS